MSLRKENYKDRLIDKKIEIFLEIAGAVSIEGPKWCGKTWTSLNHANSVVYLTDRETRYQANNGVERFDENDSPLLIDEWQLVPRLWDDVRLSCDLKGTNGNYILTGSTSLTKAEIQEQIHHSGIGRIIRLNMFPLSLYESGESNGSVSLNDLLEEKEISMKRIKKLELEDLAKIVIRGGWPENLDVTEDAFHLLPRQYVKVLCENDIDEKIIQNYSSEKMRKILRSLSRNECTMAGDLTIFNDIIDHENDEDTFLSRTTISKYIDILDRLHIINDIKPFNTNYRSSNRIGKTVKRHLVDPSLACASLRLTKEKLVGDHKTFGYMFESLALRDLNIYMDYLDGDIYQFRDNSSGDEVDAILEFEDGNYAACEIKLNNEYDENGVSNIEKGINSLKKYYEKVKKKPKFMFVLIGSYDAVFRDEETGIYIIPINALRP